MQIPNDVTKILSILTSAGFSAYVVGGCVRDGLMGKAPKDWDVATSALPGEVKGLFRRTFDTGIKHGTITVVMGRTNYEITTFRLDGEYLDNRRPETVSFDATLTDDLARRDFTMNAIAYHPSEGFIDPFGGREDIRAGTIRGVGDPDRRFREDALRMLRAVRFSGQLGFEIERNTYEAISRNAALLRNISVERVRDEFTKLLASDNPEKLNLLAETGILSGGWPPSLEISPEELAKAAALLPGLDKKHGSAAIYALLLAARPAWAGDGCVKGYMAGMRFDNDTVRRTARIVEWASEPAAAGGYELRKFVSRCGADIFAEVLAVKRAVFPELAEEFAEIGREAARIFERGDCLDLRNLAVNGDDLKALGLGGREIGEALARLLDVVLREPE
ncbi:MAG: CCA tRNA nucleotidyltransferase, partial [Defluviitaleaceae bacterium]|nr:CCA tRNA nucleotidyltransferase [Defluviitaleaceae bacterium]